MFPILRRISTLTLQIPGANNTYISVQLLGPPCSSAVHSEVAALPPHELKYAEYVVLQKVTRILIKKQSYRYDIELLSWLNLIEVRLPNI